jgi:hypothetical protein
MKHTVIEHTSLAEIETSFRKGPYRVLAFFKNNEYADKALIAYLNRACSTVAQAQPVRNKIIILDDMYNRYMAIDPDVGNRLINHELGHIQDYKDKGFIKFWIQILLELKPKMNLLKEMAIARTNHDTDRSQELIEKYYDLPSEKAANSYSGYTYKDFCVR